MRRIPDDAVMLVKEAAESFGVGEACVRQWIKQGKLPARKLGRRWVILGRDLRRALQAGQGDDSGENIRVAIYAEHATGAGKVYRGEDTDTDDVSIYQGTPAELLARADELEQEAHKSGAGRDIYLLRSASALRREARAYIEEGG